MRRDRAIAAGLTVALVVAVAGATLSDLQVLATGNSNTSAATLREGVLGRAFTASPFTASTQPERDLVQLLFSGLVRLNAAQDPVPDLAESWSSSSNGGSWTFRLRSDAYWSDGTPVTAADVAFTYTTLADPGYTGSSAGAWTGITATALDDRTVRIDLATPIEGFLVAAAQPIAPKHLLADVPVEQIADAEFNREPVGSGPYRIDTWADDHVTLVASRNGPTAGTASVSDVLGGALPAIGTIELDFYDTPEQLEAALEGHAVDSASGLPADLAAKAATAIGGRVVSYPGTVFTSLALNLRVGSASFRDVRVRRALLQAIDRDALVSDVLAGAGQVADTPIPPASWAFDAKAAPRVAPDLTAARKLLKDAGWTQKDGAWVPKGASAPLVVELLAPAAAVDAVARKTADVVVADLAALGISATVTELDAAALADRLSSADFSAAIIDFNIGLDPDLYPLLASTQTKTGGTNISGFQSVELDKRLAAARVPGTHGERLPAFASVQQLLGEQQVMIPLYFANVTWVIPSRLTGPTTRLVSDASQRFWDVLTWRLAGER